MKDITFSFNCEIAGDDLCGLFNAADEKGKSWEGEKLARAHRNSDFVASAWDGEKLIGVARVITDGEYNGYVNGLRIHPNYQGNGLGRKLMGICASQYPRHQFISLFSR